MNKLKKFVALALVLCMVLTFVPVSAQAASEDFLRVYHLDCGRKFFDTADVEELIDVLSASGYTHLELALGNDGLRLILDDMSVLTYDSASVAAGVKAGNIAYSHAGEWTEAQMDGIIDYANARNIEIIPLINTPGHMDAILDAMESVGINGAYNGSARTVDVTNAEAVAFTQALVGKYVEYFASKGCTYFNMGADEYANDIYTSGAMGFGHLQTYGLYDEFADYVNGVADIIKDAGMTPIAFNDGLYFNGNSTAFDTDIIAAYWTSGWGSYAVASAATLDAKGHKILNTNDGWYYVLGRASGTYGYSGASSAVASTPVTDVSGSNDPAVIGAMACLWCDDPSVGYASYESNVHYLAETLADSNPDYFVAASAEEVPETSEPPVTSTAPKADVSEERTVTVNVGGSATDTISGGEYTADETELDKSIATVSVKTSPAQEASVKYTAASVEIADLLDSNTTTRTNTGYYYSVNGSYYPLYATRSFSYNTYRYTYTWYYTTDNGSSFTEIDTQSTYYTSDAPNIDVYSKSGTDAVAASTTVTFRGVKLGTTYVQVGDVRYTINVTDEAPSNALTTSSVTLEYFITNYTVHTSSSANAASSTTISAANASTEEGIALNTVAPEVGYSNFDGWVTVYYWQTMRLDSDHTQTSGGAANDMTSYGTTMTHVRYHNSAWQYKALDGSWNYLVSGDQLAAYYLQKTDLTDQITTYSKDWGYVPDSDGTPDTSSGNGQSALSVAVVDGNTLTPAEADIVSSSTTIFNYWSDRDIGIVAPVNNSNYEIYKITYTYGTRATNTSSNIWYDTDTINWNKVDNDLGTAKWYDETVVWDLDKDGGTPMVNGKTSGITWKAKNTAILILIYIRATDANLTVKYVDDSLAGAAITERGVFADQGESFYDLEQTSAVPSADGFFTLDDNATLTYHNDDTDKDIVQTFEKSLLNFQDIQPQYRSGAYKYVGAEIADDGKTLILHYDIDETKLDPKYVVDFGLSVSVALDKIVDNYGTADISSVQMMNAAYGNAAIADGVLTYTPNAVLQSPAAVTLKVTYANGSVVPFNVGFLPATTVHYEEGFAAFTAGTWTDNASTGTGEQTLQTATNNDGNYGYDAKYANESGMSNGTQAVSGATGDKAELTFTGTGIDIYANCDTSTSTVAVLLYKADGSLVKMYQVDTSAVAGTTGATDGQGVTSYSLPIVSIQGLDHGTYKVIIQHTKPASDTAEFRLDGFRVYNTMTDMSDYAADENTPAFVELRNLVLAAEGITEASKSDPYNWSGTLVDQVYANEGTLSGVVYLRRDLTSDETQDLLENGPKNELFLFPGDAVTFNVSGKAQIGLKALNGEVSYSVNDTPYSVTTSTDMFYHEGEYSGAISIVNTSESAVLSLTKLKLINGAAVQQVSAEQIVTTLSLMGVAVDGEIAELPEIVAPETDYAEAVLDVALVDYKGRTVGNVSLSANGVKGESVIFTAEEILTAAKAQMPAKYALVDESAIEDVRVTYGKTVSTKAFAGLTAVVKITYISKRTGAVVGEAEIVAIQTSASTDCKITAAQIKANAPAGCTVTRAQNLKAAYGYTYSVAVSVI